VAECAEGGVAAPSGLRRSAGCRRVQASSSSLSSDKGLFRAASQSKRGVDRPGAAHVRAGRLAGSAAASRPVAAKCWNFAIASARAVAALSEHSARSHWPVRARPRAPRRICSGRRERALVRNCWPRDGGPGIGQPPCSSSTLAADGSAQHLEPDGGFSRLNAGSRKLFILLLQIVAGFVLAVCVCRCSSGSARRTS